MNAQHGITDSSILTTTNCNTTYCVDSNTSQYKPTILYQPSTVTSFIALYLTLLIIGLMSNIYTCRTVVSSKLTTLSIYIYIMNLVVCDLLILFFYIPTQMVYIHDQLTWTLGGEICKLANVVLSLSLTCTIGTLLAIAIDRARGLLQPFKWRSETMRNAKISILIIWLLSIAINLPLLLSRRDTKGAEAITFCSDAWPELEHGEVFWTVIFVVVFALPLIMILILYLAVLRRINKLKSSSKQRSNRRLMRMGSVLSVVFFVCTGCQHIFFFVTATNHNIHLSLETLAFLFALSNLLVSLQAAINPFIYGKFGSCLKKRIPTIKLSNNFTYDAPTRKSSAIYPRYSSQYSSRSDVEAESPAPERKYGAYLTGT